MVLYRDRVVGSGRRRYRLRWAVFDGVLIVPDIAHWKWGISR
jgi:hypothetical protein